MAKLPALIAAALLSFGCTTSQDPADLIHWRTQRDDNIVVQPVHANRAATLPPSAPPTSAFLYAGRVHTDLFGPIQSMDRYVYLVQPDDTAATLAEKLETAYFAQTPDNRFAIQGKYLGEKCIVGSILPGQTLSIYISTGQPSGQYF